MSIAINSNPERDQIVASAAQVLFTYSFPVFAATYLKVYQRGGAVAPDDSTQLLAYPGAYTVQGVGEAAGGTITLTVPASVGDIITIVGAEPIERASVFQDLNPFTVSLNQQLNEQTVMAQQTYTYWNHLTPRYNFDELISPEVRPFKRILPMLPNGHVWVGRGELGDDPDDITTAQMQGGGNVNASGAGMRASIARWTGVDFVQTDSEINVLNNYFTPTAGTAYETAGFDDTWGAFHWPAHITADRPAVANEGDTYFDTTLNKPYVYMNGAWVQFATGSESGGGGTSETITQAAHGLLYGEWVTYDGMSYVLAQADSAQNAEGIWMVTQVIDVNTFILTQSGPVSGMGAASYIPMTPGAVYFLSETVAGEIGLAEPTAALTVSKPCFIATGTDKGWIFPWRGQLNDTECGSPGTAGAPINATYITQTPNGDLTNEQALSLLGSGLMYNTTGTGVVSIAVNGTDYYGPGTPTDIPVSEGGTGAGTFTAYSPIFAGTTATGAFQSTSVGTAGQVLTSNGAGAIATFQNPVAGGGGGTLITTTTGAADPTIDFEGLFDGTYDRYEFSGNCISTSSYNDLFMAIVGTGVGPVVWQDRTYLGSTVMRGPSAYWGQYRAFVFNDTYSLATSGFQILLAYGDQVGLGNQATHSANFKFTIWCPHSTTLFKTMSSECTYSGAATAGFPSYCKSDGQWGVTTALTSIRFQFHNGNITGPITVVGF